MGFEAASNRPRGSRASGWRCRGISRPPRSSSSPACWAQAAEGLLIRNVGMNPTRTGLLDILRAMGGDIEV